MSTVLCDTRSHDVFLNEIDMSIKNISTLVVIDSKTFDQDCKTCALSLLRFAHASAFKHCVSHFGINLDTVESEEFSEQNRLHDEHLFAKIVSALKFGCQYDVKYILEDVRDHCISQYNKIINS